MLGSLLSVHPEWMFGKLTCQLYISWRSQTANCSIITLMFIALDRCAVSQLYMSVGIA